MPHDDRDNAVVPRVSPEESTDMLDGTPSPDLGEGPSADKKKDRSKQKPKDDLEKDEKKSKGKSKDKSKDKTLDDQDDAKDESKDKSKDKGKGGLRQMGQKAMMALQTAKRMASMMLKLKLLAWMQQLLAMLMQMAMAVAQAVAGFFVAIGQAFMHAVTVVANFLGATVQVAGAIMGTVLFGGIIGVAILVGALTNQVAIRDGVIDCYTDDTYMAAERPVGISENQALNGKIIYTTLKNLYTTPFEGLVVPECENPEVYVAGILGNWQHESGVDGTAVETIFDEPFAVGLRKKVAWQGHATAQNVYSHSHWTTTESSGTPGEDDYDEWEEDHWSHSYSYTEIHVWYTATLADGSEVTAYDKTYIETCPAIYDESASHVMNGHSVTPEAGIPNVCEHGTACDDEDDGSYCSDAMKEIDQIDFQIRYFDPHYAVTYPTIIYMGVGLGQWTNDRNRGLMQYAEAHHTNWYDVATQLMYALTEDAGRDFMLMFPSYPCETMTEAARVFLAGWEMGQSCAAWPSVSATWPSDSAVVARSTREEYSKVWYDYLVTMKEGWDYTDGAGIGLYSAASGVLSAAADHAAASSMRACSGATFLDNSSAYMAAISFAWGPDRSNNNLGTKCWQHIFSTLNPRDPYFKSCDRTVATAIHWSGTDCNFPLGACVEIANYLEEQNMQYQQNGTGRWERIDIEWTGDPDEYIAQLRPGDILIRSDNAVNILGRGNKYRDLITAKGGILSNVGHVIMFVGEDNVRRRWPDTPVGSGYNIVSGSYMSRSPGVGKMTFAADPRSGNAHQYYIVYRNTRKVNTAVDPHTGNVVSVKDTTLTCASYSNDE